MKLESPRSCHIFKLLVLILQVGFGKTFYTFGKAHGRKVLDFSQTSYVVSSSSSSSDFQKSINHHQPLHLLNGSKEMNPIHQQLVSLSSPPDPPSHPFVFATDAAAAAVDAIDHLDHSRSAVGKRMGVQVREEAVKPRRFIENQFGPLEKREEMSKKEQIKNSSPPLVKAKLDHVSFFKKKRDKNENEGQDEERNVRRKRRRRNGLNEPKTKMMIGKKKETTSEIGQQRDEGRKKEEMTTRHLELKFRDLPPWKKKMKSGSESENDFFSTRNKELLRRSFPKRFVAEKPISSFLRGQNYAYPDSNSLTQTDREYFQMIKTENGFSHLQFVANSFLPAQLTTNEQRKKGNIRKKDDSLEAGINTESTTTTRSTNTIQLDPEVNQESAGNQESLVQSVVATNEGVKGFNRLRRRNERKKNLTSPEGNTIVVTSKAPKPTTEKPAPNFVFHAVYLRKNSLYKHNQENKIVAASLK